MGRATTAGSSSGRRPTRSQVEDDASSPLGMQFPRRFPRLGTGYQVRVPPLPAPSPGDAFLSSSRPPPIQLSKEFPDVPDEISLRILEPSHLELETAASWCPSCSSSSGYEVEAKRGGRMVHQPHGPADDAYLEIVGVAEYELADDSYQWSQELVHWHAAQSDTTTSGRRKARARKRHAEKLDRQRPLPIHCKKRKYSVIRHTEGEEGALEVLCTMHLGRVAQASHCFLVHSAAGKSTTALRAANKRRQNAESHTLSWRQAVLEHIPFVGDYRDPSQCEQDYIEDPSHGKIEHNQQVWKAALACGREMEDSLNDGKTLKLSEVVSFLHRACLLPNETILFGGDAENIVQEIADCMWSLHNHSLRARREQSKLMDMWFENGVDPDSLRTLLDGMSKATPLCLDDLQEMKRQILDVSDWQTRLNEHLDAAERRMPDAVPIDDLKILESFLREARHHGFRSKGLVQLQCKLEKILLIQRRILDWEKSCKEGVRESVKFVSCLVRDASRLKIQFPESNRMIAFQRDLDSWIDRANIAIRSRISFDEIKQLIDRGRKIPVDLSEHIDKLETRATMVEDWLERVNSVVPCPFETDGSVNMLQWAYAMREELRRGGHSDLHDLSSEGNRIPVEIHGVKLLQAELDARSWSTKALKLVPRNALEVNESDFDSETVVWKKGKIEEIREHLEAGKRLRERLPINDEQKPLWVLEYEDDVRSLVHEADCWVRNYERLIEDEDVDVSIRSLRDLVAQGDSIHSNLGAPFSKSSKILTKAEEWQTKFATTLERCKTKYAQLDELKVALEDGRSTVPLELVELTELQEIVDHIEEWMNRFSHIIGERRNRKGKVIFYSLEDLQAMIQEAKDLPIPTDVYQSKLQHELETILKWQMQAQNELDSIAGKFAFLRAALNETYGEPQYYDRKSATRKLSYDNDERTNPVDMEIASNDGDPNDEGLQLENGMNVDSLSVGNGESQLPCTSPGERCTSDLQYSIKSFCSVAKKFTIVTPEGELTQLLEGVSAWCTRAYKYLDGTKDIFDKRFHGAFDRFVSEGEELASDLRRGTGGDNHVLEKIRENMCLVVTDLLSRLGILVSDRDKFVSWCKRANALLSGKEGRLSIEKLESLAKECEDFSTSADVVQTLNQLLKDGKAWITTAKLALESKEKMTMQDGKLLCDEGEKIGVHCPEIVKLQKGLRAAKGWLTRVKRSKMGEGNVHVKNIQNLLEEHDSLIVAVPDVVANLRHAMKNYCICRRPYEGFMVACDSCEDWFHGPCIGISESKANRVGKYVCLRCGVLSNFKSSALSIVAIIRKWTSNKDLKKYRQSEGQKHQRRIRKESNDLKKLREQKVEIMSRLNDLQTQVEVGPALNEIQSAPSVPATEAQTAVRIPVDDSRESSPLLLGICEAQRSDLHREEEPRPSFPVTGEPTDEVAIVSSSGSNTQISDATTTEDMTASLEEIRLTIKKCAARLREFEEVARRRKVKESIEDANLTLLRKWCLRVRSLVIVPASVELADLSRPNKNGSVSKAMGQLIREAHDFKLRNFVDVADVINSFKCMSWSIHALGVLRQQPTLSDFDSLIEQVASDSIKLPDEKALKMMKSFAQRAHNWESKVAKALSPVPGEHKSFDLNVLKDLANVGDNIPLAMRMEARLQTVIEDKGTRHCFCGGPSDGRFMVSCDQCEKWYHGHCIGIDKSAADQIDVWKCNSCTGIVSNECNIEKFHDLFVLEDEGSANLEDDDETDIASCAPDPESLWPPFGLSGTETALEVLGEECCSLPACTDEWFPGPQQQAATDCMTFESTNFPDHTAPHSGVENRKEAPNLSISTSCDVKVESFPLQHGLQNVGGNNLESDRVCESFEGTGQIEESLHASHVYNVARALCNGVFSHPITTVATDHTDSK